MSNASLLQQNYFDLFQLPVSFDIDISLLKEKQWQIQKQVHPDRFANASDQEKRLAMQVAAHVNSAYKALSDDLSRVTYLLSLQGIDIDADNDTYMPVEFLMQQMELHEALEGIELNVSGLGSIDKQRARLNALWQSLLEQLRIDLDNQAWESVREVVRKLQFYQKIREDLDAKEAAIEDQLLS